MSKKQQRQSECQYRDCGKPLDPQTSVACSHRVVGELFDVSGGPTDYYHPECAAQLIDDYRGWLADEYSKKYEVLKLLYVMLVYPAPAAVSDELKQQLKTAIDDYDGKLAAKTVEEVAKAYMPCLLHELASRTSNPGFWERASVFVKNQHHKYSNCGSETAESALAHLQKVLGGAASNESGAVSDKTPF